RQRLNALDVNPLQRTLVVLGQRFAGEVIDAEDEAEPVLALLAESGPGNRAAEPKRFAFDPRLLANLAAKARDHILPCLDLAAEAVVLPEMRVAGPFVAVYEQHAAAVGREDVA